MSQFKNPRAFIPDGLLAFTETGVAPAIAGLQANPRKLPGVLKKFPEDFIVTEPVPDYPGRSVDDSQAMRFLTVGPDSDMPGLRYDREMYVRWNGRNRPACAMTVVKNGDNTWRVVDMIAQHLSVQLGRAIHHSQILTSGLKDRWAVTAQTAVVVDVSMAEMSKVDWSKFQPGRRGFFVKDIRPTDQLISLGDHAMNHFQIKVRVDGKSAAELEAHMAPRAVALARNDYRIPNAYHRQRLGPGQNLQMKGLTLITGKFDAPAGVYPFSTQVEAALFRFIFEPSDRDREQVRALRYQLQQHWQFNFEEMERMLRRDFRKYNLTLEYEIVRRLADDRFHGCCEAVLYDLRDRLSLFVGAWQAFYWNQELAYRLRKGWLEPGARANIPLPMSCEDSKRVYRRTTHGQRCLKELQDAERLASRAEPYMDAFIRDYWRRNAANPQNHPDEHGLSLDLVCELFGSCRVVDGMERPESQCLSAALVRRLFLVPRDKRTGAERPNAPRRKAFARVNGFEYEIEDGAVNLRFALRSGAYATMLVGNLFETSDPEELETSSSNDEPAEAAADLDSVA